MKIKVALIAMCIVCGGTAPAAVCWNNSQGDNCFTNDLNWGGGAGPTDYPAVNLMGVNQAMLFAGDIETRPLKLYIGNNVDTAGEMTVNGGDLTVSQFIEVGYRGAGTFYMNDGSVQTTTYDINVGTFEGASGSLNVSGGLLTAKRFFFVGEAGTGVMTMSSGTVAVTDYDFSVGQATGGSGTLTMTGGAIRAARDFIVGEQGSGVMTMSGGAVHAGSAFRVAEAAGSSGQLNFSGGTITAADLLIGAGTVSSGMIAFSGAAEMILDGDEADRVQGYMDDGYLTGGLVTYDSAQDQTIITAVREAGIPVQIADVAVEDSNILLSWDSAAATSYDVLTSSNLVSGGWRVADTILAAGGSVTWTSGAATEAVFFYKVEAEPAGNPLNTFVNEYTGPQVSVTMSGATSNGFSVMYDTVSTGDSRVVTSLAAPLTLAEGESALLTFTWSSTQLGTLNHGFQWGFDFGANVVQVSSDTKTPASVFHLHRYDATGSPLTTEGTAVSWTTPDTALPATNSYFMPGNIVTVTSVLTRVSGDAYALDVNWGGQTYSSSAAFNSDHEINSIFFIHGQASGGGVAIGDNFTISTVSLERRAPPFELSDDFISYIQSATNPHLLGLATNESGEARFYPYSPPIGRRIAYDQPIPDKALYLVGWSFSDAEMSLTHDLEETVEQLRPIVLQKTGQSFDNLPRDSQEILVDFGYSEGVALLSDALVDAAISLNWSVLMDPWVYVRYEADWPDSVRNKAYLDRWGEKGGL